MDELINRINMWKHELERQSASSGIMTVFDSICTYLGDQYRLTEQQKELLRRYENGEKLFITYPKSRITPPKKKVGMKHLEK